MLPSPIYEYTPTGFVIIILLNTFLWNVAEKGRLNSFGSKARDSPLFSLHWRAFLFLPLNIT